MDSAPGERECAASAVRVRERLGDGAAHDGGDPIPADGLTVAVSRSATTTLETTPVTSERTADDSVTVATATGDDAVVRLVWSSPNCGETATIAQWES